MYGLQQFLIKSSSMQHANRPVLVNIPGPKTGCVCCLQICLIRSLAFDENKAERAQRGLDLGCLDSMSWPEYVWEYLYMHEDDLRHHRQVHTISCCALQAKHMCTVADNLRYHRQV